MVALDDLQQTAANVGRHLADATNTAVDAFSGLWPDAATTISNKAWQTKGVVQDTASKAISTVGETSRSAVQQGAAFVGQKATGLSEKLADNPQQRSPSNAAAASSGTASPTHPKAHRKGAPLNRKPAKNPGKTKTPATGSHKTTAKHHATRSVKQPAATAKSPTRKTSGADDSAK